jgi:hypothetical protein
VGEIARLAALCDVGDPVPFDDLGRDVVGEGPVRLDGETDLKVPRELQELVDEIGDGDVLRHEDSLVRCGGVTDGSA